jgi:hypothetical protein
MKERRYDLDEKQRRAWYGKDGRQTEGLDILPGRPLCYNISQRSLLVTSIRETIFTVAGRAIYRTLSTRAECFREARWVDWSELGGDR